jgi:hypothetical protein
MSCVTEWPPEPTVFCSFLFVSCIILASCPTLVRCLCAQRACLLYDHVLVLRQALFKTAGVEF